jgi:hypothetical protein
MGNSSYSDDAADRIYTHRAATSTPAATFTNTTKGILDPRLDPKGVKYRESCDSKEHPESNPVAVFFDQTGSMGDIPRMFAFDKTHGLPGLMRVLVGKNYLPDPQLLYGCVGDGPQGEIGPLQVGQFESGLEMDEWLTAMLLEGKGGSNNMESYDLALYFAARHMKLDSVIHRNKKGYLFIIGDEEAYPSVDKRVVERYIGDKLQSDIPIKDIIKEAQKLFEVFRLCVPTGYPDGSFDHWKNLLGQHAILLKEPGQVCDVIAATIGACEGRDLDDIRTDLTDKGSSARDVDAALGAIVPFVSSKGAALTRGTVAGALDKPSGSPARSKRV